MRFVWLILFLSAFPVGLRAVDSAWTIASFVNWDYRHRDPLIGWKTTAELIAVSFRDWGFPVQHHSMENQNITELRRFLANPSAGAAPAPALVYLSGHQTPDGRFDFPDQEVAEWASAVLPTPLSTARADASPPRILIVDTCHAAVVLDSLARSQHFDWILAAADAREETFQLRMFARREVDFRRRYPREVAWMRSRLDPQWDGSVSFFGFCWTVAAMRVPAPPRSSDDWRAFFTDVSAVATEFRAKRSRHLASSILIWPPQAAGAFVP